MSSVASKVQEFYSKDINKSGDFKSNVCTLGMSKLPSYVKQIQKIIHPEVLKRYYGCTVSLPEALEDQIVLDLGCGAGQDCFILSRLVGQNGHVTGVDMTQQLLDVASEYTDYHTQLFEYNKPNVDFVLANIEDLQSAGIKDNTYDVIFSNCVVNLCSDKRKVLKEAFRVLKNGGEFYFSDMYASRRIPESLMQDKELLGEGFGGALWWQDLVDLAQEAGFMVPQIRHMSKISITDKELEKIIKSKVDAEYAAVTYRLFKIKSVSPADSYLATYDGKLSGYEDSFQINHSIKFLKQEKKAVDKSLAGILLASRFSKFFTVDILGNGNKEENQQVAENPFDLICAQASCGK